MAEFKLINEIIKFSNSNIWEIAKKEWILLTIDLSDDPYTCLCGHTPIFEICKLENRINKNIVTVGNCCVNKFIGLPTKRIFNAIKRIKKDNYKSLNSDAIELALSKNWINDWEYKFYIDTLRKRELSQIQLNKRNLINNKILFRISLNKKD